MLSPCPHQGADGEQQELICAPRNRATRYSPQVEAFLDEAYQGVLVVWTLAEVVLTDGDLPEVLAPVRKELCGRDDCFKFPHVRICLKPGVELVEENLELPRVVKLDPLL